MRNVPDELAARIESGAATLCHVWLLRRADGRAMGFTDHDRDLEVEGAACRAASGWTGGAGDGEVGLAAGALSASGGLDDAAITEEDIAAGRYDAAEVELWRVDWMRPDLRVRLWKGWLARIRARTGASSPIWTGRWRRWSGWSGGPMAGAAMRCWAMDGAGWMRRRSRGATATSGGRPVSGCLGMELTFRAFRTFRAKIS